MAAGQFQLCTVAVAGCRSIFGAALCHQLCTGRNFLLLIFLEIFCSFFFPLQFLSPLHLKSEFISVSIKQVTHFHIILHSKHLLSLEDALSSPQV